MRKNKGNKKKGRAGKQQAIPLAPPQMRSRKRARVITSTFHKLTREKDLAVRKGDLPEAKRLDDEIEAMGGRLEYQRASQLSTSYHSTSRWVLGFLERCGWLYGITVQTNNGEVHTQTSTKRRKLPRRHLRLLEVGAINTELLDAAAEVKRVDKGSDGSTIMEWDKTQLKYNLNVRAIDLHSCHQGIEEMDFLQLPLLHRDVSERYDVAVCSMVINCVTTAKDRGCMLARLFHHLRPGGLLFLTLPKLCLIQSPHTTPELFLSMLSTNGGIGFEVEETRESPKVAFFVLRRPEGATERCLDDKWTRETIIRRGKKYRNSFSVVLDEDQVLNDTF